MKRVRWAFPGGRRGQTLVEYAITAGVILALLSGAALLLYVFKEDGGRILDRIASEFP